MSSVLIGIGLILMFFGIWGTIVLPDLLMRLHASTKCGVTGSVTILIGLALRSGSGTLRDRDRNRRATPSEFWCRRTCVTATISPCRPPT